MIKNQTGTTLLITLLILSSILVVSLISSDIVISGLKAGLGRQDSTKAYFAAESGIERILLKQKEGIFDYGSCGDECENLGTLLDCSDCATSDLNSLDNGASYRVRYASSTPNIYFTSFGSYKDVSRAVAISFYYSGGGPAFVCGEDVVYEGETYPTVEIGTQCWMAKNLNVGTMKLGTQEQTDDDTIEKYCYYNDPNDCNIYGGFYQWNEATQYVVTPGAQGICPSDWHIPTDVEWHTLEDYLKDEEETCDPNRILAFDCDPAGTALKSAGSSGFNGLLAGRRILSGDYFSDRLNFGYFWSSNFGSARSLGLIFSGIHRNAVVGPEYGYSIRCLKD